MSRAPVPIARPLLAYAAMTCPQARAITIARRSLEGAVRARRYQEAAARSRAVHARLPENARDSATRVSEISMARARPPAVAAGRDRPSPRRNQYNPRP